VKSWLVRLASLAVVLAACSPVPPAPSAVAERWAAATATEDLSVEPAPSRCVPRPFDATASLDPAFDHDIFVRDESEGIAGAFLAGLETIYADPATTDVCRFFTERGWQTALAVDPRLRAAGRGETQGAPDLVLRVAFEGTYDLRIRPPIVPLDIIFDVDDGAGTTVSRDGFQVAFLFDGHRWRADEVAPITGENAEWVALPSTPSPGPPCGLFIRDARGTAFDDDAARGWCTDGGRGRIVTDRQLVLLTRYPCEVGHAAVLNLGRPLGVSLDPLNRQEYVRDPAGEFLAQHWVRSPYDGDATLPADAADSGWTNGNVDLWISPSELDRAVYLVRGDVVERWPRAARSWGVIDCN
jgi:hypothetical protein